MTVLLPKPSVTTDEVVLERADWDQLVSAVESNNDEDADDIAAVVAARSEDAQVAALVEAERGSAVETTIAIEVIRAEIDGEHPLKAWRDYRGWSQADLATKSGVAGTSIAQIEARRGNAGIESLSRLARALGIPMDALVEDESE